MRAAHVPYSALPQAIGDLLNGTNHYQFITPLPVLDLIATGKLRALAVTAPDRIAALKDVPTVGEAGFPELIIQDWVGLLVKAGTPNETVARLNAAINKVLALPNVREAFAKMAAESGGGTPAEFGSHVKYRIEYGGRVAVISGDTRFNANVIKYATGADLLIHEVAIVRPALASEPYIQRIMAHHTTAREAGMVFERTKPKLAAYTHLVFLASERTPAASVDDLIAETRHTYAGPLEVGQDLMAFEIGEAVSVRRWGSRPESADN